MRFFLFVTIWLSHALAFSAIAQEFCDRTALEDRIRFALEPTFTILKQEEGDEPFKRAMAIVRFLYGLKENRDIFFNRKYIAGEVKEGAGKIWMNHQVGDVVWTLWRNSHVVGLGVEGDPVVELKTPGLFPEDVDPLLSPYYQAADEENFSFEMGGGHLHGLNAVFERHPVRFVNLLIHLHNDPRYERIFSGGEIELTLFQRGYQDEFIAAVAEFRRRMAHGEVSWDDVWELFSPLYGDHHSSVRMLKNTTEFRSHLAQRTPQEFVLQMLYYQAVWDSLDDEELMEPRRWDWKSYVGRINRTRWQGYRNLLSGIGLEWGPYESMVRESLENRRLHRQELISNESSLAILYAENPEVYFARLEDDLVYPRMDYREKVWIVVRHFFSHPTVEKFVLDSIRYSTGTEVEISLVLMSRYPWGKYPSIVQLFLDLMIQDGGTRLTLGRDDNIFGLVLSPKFGMPREAVLGWIREVESRAIPRFLDKYLFVLERFSRTWVAEIPELAESLIEAFMKSAGDEERPTAQYFYHIPEWWKATYYGKSVAREFFDYIEATEDPELARTFWNADFFRIEENLGFYFRRLVFSAQHEGFHPGAWTVFLDQKENPDTTQLERYLRESPQLHRLSHAQFDRMMNIVDAKRAWLNPVVSAALEKFSSHSDPKVSQGAKKALRYSKKCRQMAERYPMSYVEYTWMEKKCRLFPSQP